MNGSVFDTGTLSWVKDEIDLALDRAGEALARHAAQPEAPKPLAEARRYLHQASGALTIVGLAGITHFAETIEARLAGLVDADKSGVVAVDAAAGAALAALRRYLDDLMAGHPDQPLRLLPTYRSLELAAGRGEPSPIDLFFPDLTLRPPRRAETIDLTAPRLKALRLGFARGLTKWRESEVRGLTEMRNALVVLEQSLAQPGERTLWWVALAWFDALLAQAAPRPDSVLLDALDHQFGMLTLAGNAAGAPPAVLLRGLLYGIATTAPGTDHLECVRAAYRLADLMPATTTTVETRRETCRAPLQTAMAEWERFSQGNASALIHFHDVVLLLAASARESGDSELDRLTSAISDFAAWLHPQPERMSLAMALELASALVLIEDAIEQEGARNPTEEPLFAAEVTAELERLAAIRQTGEVANRTLAHQRWRERRLVARAAQEVWNNLDAIEAGLDHFMRATEPQVLPADIQRQMHQVVGVLRLLDEETAISLAAALEAAIAQMDGQPVDVPAAEQIAEWITSLSNFAAELIHGQPDRARLASLHSTGRDVRAVAATPPPCPAAAIPSEVAPNVATSLPPADGADPQLVAIFLEEADEQLDQLTADLRAWHASLSDAAIGRRLARLLHTFKGGARMCGAKAIGELAHGMEACIEQALTHDTDRCALLTDLDASLERVILMVAALHQSVTPVHAVQATGVPSAEDGSPAVMLRVRADLIDHLLTEAGEIAISRSRIERSWRNSKSGLLDLGENIARLRSQLRELEMVAETSMQSRQGIGLIGQGGQQRDFDPLEFDRFTRLQELARILAESVNDVATVQHTLLRQTDATGEALAAQLRQNRELSHALLHARMVPFSTVAERLQRVVRQTARELGCPADLAIRGAETPIDRSVLERMLGPLEHLLRNAVTHGIEPAARRQAAKKPEAGQLALTITPTDKDITLTLTDDGGGLDLAAIRQRAGERGLLAAGANDADVADLIFRAGVSTAATVSEVAGRGIGLDVVHDAVTHLGGRVEVSTQAGQGTRFTITLPFTLAVIPVMLVRAGNRSWAIPAGMIEEVRELTAREGVTPRGTGHINRDGRMVPWHTLPQLFGEPVAAPTANTWQLVLKAGSERIILEVDAITQSQEVVVKPVGDQLARVPGLTGATVLPDGSVALIVNPIALARHSCTAVAPTVAVPPAPTLPAATVMVVDDSLTVRKLTGRLLERAGYHVMTAKDGVDALAQLEHVTPAVMLADIEMPRMDGFELVRTLRANPHLTSLPVIMITSRTADKHRQVAAGLGVRHFLGKPYDEDTLLTLIATLTTT